MNRVLDISVYNNLNKADYDAIAKNYAGVIMRIGYTGYGKPAKNKVIDTRYEKHDAELRARRVPLGIYWYGTDETVKEVQLAAKTCLGFAKGREYPLGVFYDTEDNHYQRQMSKNALTAVVLGFTNYIEKNSKYRTGVYASTYWFKDELHFDQLKGLIIWEANYGSNNGTLNSKPRYNPELHQFTSNHFINGKRFDNNAVRNKYWTDVKPPTKPDKPDAAEKTLEQLVQEVYDRKHGDGDERKASLGNRYEEVQAEIEKIEAAKKPAAKKVKVGDTVKFEKLANRAEGGTIVNAYYKEGKVDKIFTGKPYPYRIIRGGDYMGFVNDKMIGAVAAVTFEPGDIIKIKNTAKKYVTGESIGAAYKNKNYTIAETRKQEALIKELYSWVYFKDLTFIK